MSNKRKKQLTPVQQEYQTLEDDLEIKRPVFKN
ncbi:MAG: stage V sporulation protein AC, partial [Bacillota bacterium]